MSGTPKDAEILEQLDTFITTVSNTFVLLVNGLAITALVQSDPITALWYEKRFGDVSIWATGCLLLAQSGQSGMSAHRSRFGVKRTQNARDEHFSP
jgi:hypothetical protein